MAAGGEGGSGGAPGGAQPQPPPAGLLPAGSRGKSLPSPLCRSFMYLFIITIIIIFYLPAFRVPQPLSESPGAAFTLGLVSGSLLVSARPPVPPG